MVACVVRSTAHAGGSRGHEPGIGAGTSRTTRENGSSRRMARGFDPCFRASGRRTVSGVAPGQALEEKKPRRAPARRSHPGQGRGRREHGPHGGSKASKRACRPPTGEPGVHEERRSRSARFAARATDRLSGREEPTSRPHSPASPRGRVEAKGRRGGESGREDLEHAAPGSGRTRTRTEATAGESGYGSPRGEKL